MLDADGINLGPDPDGMLADVLDQDAELVMPLADERWAWIPALLGGTDACAVLHAWELVERGHVAVDDFKAVTHDNGLALWGDEMFANTVIGTR